MVEDVDPCECTLRERMSVACDACPKDEQERLQLVRDHELMFRAIARKLHTSRDEMEDALQGARLGFLIALDRFDPSMGTSIGSYARGFIAKEILIATFRDPRGRRQARGSVELGDAPDERVAGIDDGFARVDAACDGPAVKAFLQTLPPIQREVAIRLAIEGATAVEIADERGVSVRAIWKTWAKVRDAGVKELRGLSAA